MMRPQRTRRALWAPALIAIIMTTSSARAFKILSALTEGCHEKMTLGILGLTPPGAFRGNDLPSVAPMLARMIQKVETDGVPQDDATRGLRRENARRYAWGNFSDAQLQVYSSFLAGVRSLDTGGHSIVDFSQIRGSHIRDEEQSAHFLRRKNDDGNPGDLAAIQEAKTRLITRARSILASWATGQPQNRIERWTFAFYGERDVTVFAPAFDLGIIAHALQDSYAHALRDEADLKIIAVSNYLDLIRNEYNGERDGPGHSERLDQCNEHDSFDAPRIEAARVQTARVFEAMDAQLAASTQDVTGTEAVIDATFSYRAGCTAANSYCDGLWYKKAREEISEPYEIGCGLTRPRTDDHHHHGPHLPDASASLLRNAMILFLLAGLPALVAWWRRRTRG